MLKCLHIKQNVPSAPQAQKVHQVRLHQSQKDLKEVKFLSLNPVITKNSDTDIQDTTIRRLHQGNIRNEPKTLVHEEEI